MNTKCCDISDLLDIDMNKELNLKNIRASYISSQNSKEISKYSINKEGKLVYNSESDVNRAYLAMQRLKESAISDKQYFGHNNMLKIASLYSQQESNFEKMQRYEQLRPQVYKGAIMLSR